MAITVECSNCGRRYNVDDSIAGRTVKCRQCGNLIQVPRSAAEGLDPEVDLSTLSALAESPVSDEQAAMQRMPRVDAAPGSEMGVEGEVDAQTFGRQNFRFTFPYAKQIDQYLPIILAVIGIFVAGYSIVDNDTSNRTWMVILRFVIVFVVYAFVACPLALVGLRKAGRAMRFQMPRKPKWRTFTAFMPALMLGVLFWFIGQSLIGLVLGVVSGLIIAVGLIWLLFRLQPHEIVSTALYGATGFLGGAVLAGAILFGMNMLTLNVFNSMNKSLPGSPFGELFTWRTLPAVESGQPPKKPTIASTKPLESAPQPAPTENTQVALVPANQTNPNPPTPSPTPTQPAPQENTTSNPPVPTPTPTTTVSSQTTAVQITKSPLVTEANLAEAPGAFQSLIETCVPSPAFALVKNDQNGFRIELWNSADWTKKGTFTPANASGAADKYIVSPSGDLLVRLAKFPGLSAQIYSFSAGSVTKTIELTPPVAGAVPEPMAMPTEDRLLIRWDRGTGIGIETIDISTNKHKGIDTIPFDHRPRGWAVGEFEGGRWLAIPSNIGGPNVFLYDLNGVRQVKKMPITSLDPSQYTQPTGLAFSTDKRLAVLLERDGNGLLLDWDTQANRAARTHVFPNGPIPGRADQRNETSSLDWVPTLDAWLMYGQGIFDAVSGKEVGQLGVPDVQAARFVDPNNPETVVLTVNAQNGLKELVKVELNVEALKEALKKKGQ
jgi:predicted Zn finger-like uncharacterized protein